MKWTETLKKWLNRLRGRKEEIAVVTNEGKPVAIVATKRAVEQARRRVFIPRKLPRPGEQASRKGYGKFMKHSKRQRPDYRRTVHEKVNPEEEKD